MKPWAGATLLLFAACSPPNDRHPADPCAVDAVFVDPGGTDWLFELDAAPAGGPISLDLCLASSAVASLRTEPDREVALRLVTPYGAVEGATVRLRGQVGSSFQPVDSKPYLGLRLPTGVAGIRQFRLYNLWQDVGQVQGYLGYRMWREVGHPAPRSGFASVTLNGRDLGLYGLIEEVNEDFFSARPDDFPVAVGNLYEGEYGADLTAETIDDVELLASNTFSELGLLTAAIDATEDLRSEAVSQRLDYTQWARFWALEMLVGAQEGYSPLVNNYYLFEAAEAPFSRFTMVPWGFDMTLSASPRLEEPQGVLARKGLQHPGSAALLMETLACERERVPWRGLLAELDRVIPILEPVYTRPFSAEDGAPLATSPDDILTAQEAVAAFLVEQPAAVERWLDAKGVQCPTGADGT